MSFLKSSHQMSKSGFYAHQFTILSRELLMSIIKKWNTKLMKNSTNVPHIAMCFSDNPFPYGPFVPHHVPRQYVASYFSLHETDSFLELNTTVEDLSRITSSSSKSKEQWNLTLRKYEPARQVDLWWEETFDAVILANGHYSVPFVWCILSPPIPSI